MKTNLWLVGAFVLVVVAGGAALLMYIPAPGASTPDVSLTETPQFAAPAPTPPPTPVSKRIVQPSTPTPTPSTTPTAPTPATQTPPPQSPAPTPTPPPTPTLTPPAPEPTPPPAPKTVNVTIQNFSFNPATVTVNPGDTVVFKNLDGVAHTATASGGAFDSGYIQPGETKSITVAQKGSYSYFCIPHPYMKGTLVVQ